MQEIEPVSSETGVRLVARWQPFLLIQLVQLTHMAGYFGTCALRTCNSITRLEKKSGLGR
jgi:hypothetical protein